MRRSALLALAVASAVGGACSGDDDAVTTDPTTASSAPVVQLGGPGETNRVLSPDEATAPSLPGATEADVRFVQDMISHHEQALDMAALVESRAGRDDLAVLAERIAVSQRDEIALMETWLAERDEARPEPGHVHTSDLDDSMPGMLTPEQLDLLATSTGRAFDELFLQAMIRHHEGAVIMVEQLLTGGEGGQDPSVFQLAQGIGGDQQVEIASMKAVLAEVAAGD